MSDAKPVDTDVLDPDIRRFVTALNEAYGRYFRQAPPARATVQVSALPRGARVEIDCVAAL